MIDHLLWAVPELEAGRRQISAWTGVEPAPGGRHPGVGTHNALLSLGQGCYLELIAPDPTQERFTGLGTLLQHLEAPTLVTWCVRTEDLEALAVRAHEAGLTRGEPISMSRRRPDGVRLRWRLLMVENHSFGPLVPFFIQWDTDHHPSRSAPSGCRLEGFQLSHPQPKALVACLEKLGLEAEVSAATEPGLQAMIGTPKGGLVLPPVGGDGRRRDGQETRGA